MRRKMVRDAMDCAICGKLMVPDLTSQTFRCPGCGFLASTLPVQINDVASIDEEKRERALQPIRSVNFAQLLAECGDLLSPGTTLLDVGCAHGWFMAAAAGRGVACTGIEPDLEMARFAQAEGHDVLMGFF
jgi:2-polyprenyl-3-methyl-5-hydroxy-6-metoxy-1,4-benzoquinol methylase